MNLRSLLRKLEKLAAEAAAATPPRRPTLEEFRQLPLEERINILRTPELWSGRRPGMNAPASRVPLDQFRRLPLEVRKRLLTSHHLSREEFDDACRGELAKPQTPSATEEI